MESFCTFCELRSKWCVEELGMKTAVVKLTLSSGKVCVIVADNLFFLIEIFFDLWFCIIS